MKIKRSPATHFADYYCKNSSLGGYRNHPLYEMVIGSSDVNPSPTVSVITLTVSVSDARLRVLLAEYGHRLMLFLLANRLLASREVKGSVYVSTVRLSSV